MQHFDPTTTPTSRLHYLHCKARGGLFLERYISMWLAISIVAQLMRLH
jgi:hypothetical protein